MSNWLGIRLILSNVIFANMSGVRQSGYYQKLVLDACIHSETRIKRYGELKDPSDYRPASNSYPVKTLQRVKIRVGL